MIRFDDADIELNPKDIKQVERRFGLRLPDALVELYLATNGGVPVSRRVYEDEHLNTCVEEFLPLKSSRGNFTAPRAYEIMALERKAVAENLFPFAVDSFGDFFFVDCKVALGDVYFFRGDTADPVPLLSLGVTIDDFWSALHV